MTEQFCLRCRRPAPPHESTEFCEWEASAGDGGATVICPGCITLGEENAMLKDVEDTLGVVREQQERGLMDDD